ALAVVPNLLCLILSFDVYGPGAPIGHFAGYVVASLEEQNFLSRRGQRVAKRAPSGSGADDDHVELCFVSQGSPLSQALNLVANRIAKPCVHEPLPHSTIKRSCYRQYSASTPIQATRASSPVRRCQMVG